MRRGEVRFGVLAMRVTARGARERRCGVVCPVARSQFLDTSVV